MSTRRLACALLTAAVCAACSRPEPVTEPRQIAGAPPENSLTSLPACGGEEWPAMERALSVACKTDRTDFEARACRLIAQSWHSCPADVREAASVDESWTNEVIVIQVTGGMWHGVVFSSRDHGWQVAGFEGGDIK